MLGLKETVLMVLTHPPPIMLILMNVVGRIKDIFAFVLRQEFNTDRFNFHTTYLLRKSICKINIKIKHTKSVIALIDVL